MPASQKDKPSHIDICAQAYRQQVLKIQSYKASRLQNFTTFTFTAPHPLPLCRDGHQTHKPEEWTGFLADQFASILNGSVLTWTREERSVQEAIYEEAKKEGPEDAAEPYISKLLEEFLENSCFLHPCGVVFAPA